MFALTDWKERSQESHDLPQTCWDLKALNRSRKSDMSFVAHFWHEDNDHVTDVNLLIVGWAGKARVDKYTVLWLPGQLDGSLHFTRGMMRMWTHVTLGTHKKPTPSLFLDKHRKLKANEQLQRSLKSTTLEGPMKTLFVPLYFLLQPFLPTPPGPSFTFPFSVLFSFEISHVGGSHSDCRKLFWHKNAPSHFCPLKSGRPWAFLPVSFQKRCF